MFRAAESTTENLKNIWNTLCIKLTLEYFVNLLIELLAFCSSAIMSFLTSLASGHGTEGEDHDVPLQDLSALSLCIVTFELKYIGALESWILTACIISDTCAN